jgi:hypothetical protein
MMVAQVRSFRSSLGFLVAVVATWTTLPVTGLAQSKEDLPKIKLTEPHSAPSNSGESRPAVGQLPVPFAPSAFSWLRMAFARDSGEASPKRLPFEAIREKRDLFEGSALGGVSPAEFHRAYREVERQAEDQQPASDGEIFLPTQPLVPAYPVEAAAAQLRASARNLDNAAADLEDAGKYAEADRIRSYARRLRREARELAKPDSDEIRIVE